MHRTTSWIWLVCGLSALAPLRAADSAERWGVYEVAFQGPRAGNPFVDVQLRARFQYRNRAVDVDGFYDGDGVYRVRFMPDEIGEWSYRTSSNAPETRWPAGADRLDRARRQQSRPGARPLCFTLRVRGRRSLRAAGDHVLRLGPPGRPVGGANARHLAHRALQQDADVRVSQELRL